MNHEDTKNTKGLEGTAPSVPKRKIGRRKGEAANPGAYVPGVKRGARSAGTVPIRTGSKRADGSFDEGSFGPLGIMALEVKLACKAWLKSRGLEHDDFNFGNIYFQ